MSSKFEHQTTFASGKTSTQKKYRKDSIHMMHHYFHVRLTSAVARNMFASWTVIKEIRKEGTKNSFEAIDYCHKREHLYTGRTVLPREVMRRNSQRMILILSVVLMARKESKTTEYRANHQFFYSSCFHPLLLVQPMRSLDRCIRCTRPMIIGPSQWVHKSEIYVNGIK